MVWRPIYGRRSLRHRSFIFSMCRRRRSRSLSPSIAQVEKLSLLRLPKKSLIMLYNPHLCVELTFRILSSQCYPRELTSNLRSLLPKREPWLRHPNPRNCFSIAVPLTQDHLSKLVKLSENLASVTSLTPPSLYNLHLKSQANFRVVLSALLMEH